MKWCPPPQGAFIEKCLPILPGLAFDHCNRVGTEKHYIYIYIKLSGKRHLVRGGSPFEKTLRGRARAQNSTPSGPHTTTSPSGGMPPAAMPCDADDERGVLSR